MIKKTYKIAHVTNHPHFILTDVIIDPLSANVSTDYSGSFVSNRINYHKNRGIEIKGVIFAEDGCLDKYIHELSTWLSLPCQIHCYYEDEVNTQPIDFAWIDFNPRDTVEITPGDNPAQMCTVKVQGFSYNRLWSQQISSNQVWDIREGMQGPYLDTVDLVTRDSNYKYQFNLPLYTPNGIVLENDTYIGTGGLQIKITNTDTNYDEWDIRFTNTGAGGAIIQYDFENATPNIEDVGVVPITSFRESSSLVHSTNYKLMFKQVTAGTGAGVALTGYYRRLDV